MKGRETVQKQVRWCRLLVAAGLAVGYFAFAAAAATGGQSTPTKSPPPGAAKAPAAKAAPAQAATEPPAADDPAADEAPPPSPSGGGTTVQAGAMVGGRIESLHAKNEDLANVLEMLSREYRLNIIASKNAKGKVTADLYNVTVDQVMDAVCRANGLRWSQEGGSIYVYTVEENNAIRMDESRLATEVFSLNYLAGEDATKLITPALSPKATVAINTPTEKGLGASGGGSGGGGGSSGSTGANSFGLQDSLVVRDFPENLVRVAEILKKMDKRPRQVLVEATILQAKLDDSTSLGVDFNALAGIDFRDLTTLAATPVTNPTSNANAATTTVGNQFSKWGNINTQGFAQPGTGLNIGVMTNNVAIFINALEAVTDSVVLSNPKVLALNKQRAEVIVGDRIPYITTTNTETTAVQTVSFLDVGKALAFRPFISDDGYIRMEIHPKVSSAVLIGPQALPQETTTEVTCNVMVKDGHTIIIGGLFDDTSKITRSQVPGLGNVPGLGWLFRSNKDSSVRSEIIILLTPHVIQDEEEANEIGQQAFDDAKRRSLGIREGFAFFNRERLQVAHLQEADKALNRYETTHKWIDLDWALWNVQIALNIGPGNLKAMRLKDRILSEKAGKEVEPPVWTIWDSIHDRMKESDEAKQAAAEEAKASAAPGTAPPAGPKPETPPQAAPAPVPAPAPKS